jgi:hypothetical protein
MTYCGRRTVDDIVWIAMATLSKAHLNSFTAAVKKFHSDYHEQAWLTDIKKFFCEIWPYLDDFLKILAAVPYPPLAAGATAADKLGAAIATVFGCPHK